MNPGDPAKAHRAYSEAWKQWHDPDIAGFFHPTWYLLDRHIAEKADKPALVVDERRYTYQELLDRVDRVASGLAELGINTGERMLMFGTDSFEYIVFWLAAVRRGVIPVTISDLVRPEQFRYYLEDAAPAVLYMDAAQVSKAWSALAEVGEELRHVILRGPSEAISDIPASIHRADDLLTASLREGASVGRHANDAAYMLYSGSTTGPAKGIVHLSHDFLLIPERQGAFWAYTTADIVHATSKKYFTHGLWPGVLMPLYYGATSVISGGPPQPANVVRLIEAVRPTKLITVPTVIKEVLRWIEETGARPDFTSLGLVVTASEPMPQSIFERFYDMSGLEVMDSIGSSEITYEWIANRPSDHRRGSLGKPIFGVEVRLVSADGIDVAEAGAPGEAWVKSKTSLLYYWRKLDKTREAQMGTWTRTGDVLTCDEDGYFWFVGRNDDLFKVKGMWASPVEIEAAIARHPDVRQVAVIGAQSGDGLMVPKAYVVLRSGTSPSEEIVTALKQLARELGGYKVPDEVVFIEDLPRTPLMKIDRRELRRWNGSPF